MKPALRILAAFPLTLLVCFGQAAAPPKQKSAAPAAKSTGAGAYGTGRYRNLFLEAGHTQKEIDEKVEATFQQLFHGDPSTQSVYYPVGENANGPLAYLSDINNHDVRSEGMSYGMMIAVQMNKKAEFDALWNWSKTYMYHAYPSEPGYKFFAWSLKTDGTKNSDSPAPDGEEYWTMALYFADHRWGSGIGIYDYKHEADQLLDAMKNRTIITGKVVGRGPEAAQETDGAEFNPQYKMVRFTPDTNRPDSTDPSYHLPAFYELWARWGPEADRRFWREAAQVSRDYFVKVTDPNTALAPNYANFDATSTGRGGRPGNFGADAWRTEANWAVDWSWWAADPREQQLSDRIQKFFESKGIDTYGSNFSLDGTQMSGGHVAALAATTAITALASTDKARSMRFVEAFWNMPVPSGQGRYYDGMWYMMGMLHCSGKFQIIK